MKLFRFKKGAEEKDDEVSQMEMEEFFQGYNNFAEYNNSYAPSSNLNLGLDDDLETENLLDRNGHIVQSLQRDISMSSSLPEDNDKRPESFLSFLKKHIE